MSLEEHESFMDWWGEPFDPDAFDLEEAISICNN
jgi:hypothetical protein